MWFQSLDLKFIYYIFSMSNSEMELYENILYENILFYGNNHTQ